MMNVIRGIGVALVALVIMSAAPIATADTAATYIDVGGGRRLYTLCNAETDTTAACDDGASNIVANLGGRSQLTLYATSSTASTFSCDAYTSDSGYSATARSAITSAAIGTQLTQSTRTVSLTGSLSHVWVECSAISGGDVTVRAMVGGGQ